MSQLLSHSSWKSRFVLPTTSPFLPLARVKWNAKGDILLFSRCIGYLDCRNAATIQSIPGWFCLPYRELGRWPQRESTKRNRKHIAGGWRWQACWILYGCVSINQVPFTRHIAGVANPAVLLRIGFSFHGFWPSCNHCVSVSGNDIRIAIFLQVSQCDHPIVFQFQLLHIRLKVLLMAAHPVMSCIGNAAKLQNGNATIQCLFHCTNEVRQ